MIPKSNIFEQSASAMPAVNANFFELAIKAEVLLPRLLPRVRWEPWIVIRQSPNQLKRMVPKRGFEPRTYRLRIGCSTAELFRLYAQPIENHGLKRAAPYAKPGRRRKATLLPYRKTGHKA
jgi:hypothetical protein